MKNMNYWLLKQEPSGYNFDSLEKEKKTVWDGVHNNLALKHMRNMKKGDKAIFYHTGDERQAMGVVDIITNPYSNPKESDKRFIVFDVKISSRFKRPVTLDEIKNDSKFKNWELVRNSRLSAMPVPQILWDEILKKSKN
ncbi:MAG: EVE domain-containing protein [Thaumarchaeota archaeon]|nr:EVE domain-containing protein [Nitrososphaerota archaeon]